MAPFGWRSRSGTCAASSAWPATAHLPRPLSAPRADGVSPSGLGVGTAFYQSAAYVCFLLSPAR